MEEKQGGFRSLRSTTEHIFSLRLLVEKHLEHQKELFHNFMGFKKAFDRVLQDGLWRVLKEYKIIKSLHTEAISSVLLNGNVEDLFRSTVGGAAGMSSIFCTI